ncbi:metalloregulator ArsR/SmtB family transcription factor [Gluconobacter sp. AC10]|uniref:Metalloregulator ArsR/SmtB family transcription factor n=2 Tax=Gluconobacter aidae TaxID=2662454 RepID=A0A7X1SQ49_9PROT|nr:metalloregulator ArsR/SmtB family transcription factor [Gluconobacter aidae]
MEDIQKNVHQVAELLKTLSHPDRLLIACKLAEKELSVGEMQSELGIYQPNLSRHLTTLKSAKIVTFRKEGLSVFYHLSDTRAGQVITALHQIFCSRKH